MLAYVCVYAHTHAHCTDGVLGCEPRGRDEIPGGPEESTWTKSRHICIRICVYEAGMHPRFYIGVARPEGSGDSTHVYIYAKRREEILD